MLYVNPVFGRYVEEKGRSEPMEPAQSDALLQYLYAQADHPEYCFSFVYEPGSMAFWDNRACMHRGLSEFGQHERSMRRVTVQGDSPFFSPETAASRL